MAVNFRLKNCCRIARLTNQNDWVLPWVVTGRAYEIAVKLYPCVFPGRESVVPCDLVIGTGLILPVRLILVLYPVVIKATLFAYSTTGGLQTAR